MYIITIDKLRIIFRLFMFWFGYIITIDNSIKKIILSQGSFREIGLEKY
jgi:hypothetical protein